ncbi:hypothetical protein HHI36_005273 [Cryptolaemus montrouzieri]|uniref:RNase H type-1 domain-containing protein n=1 Tax=Cryptolaemus montrouzieri TaxID=559131 RepID=A0ABD2NU11_9CUCU
MVFGENLAICDAIVLPLEHLKVCSRSIQTIHWSHKLKSVYTQPQKRPRRFSFMWVASHVGISGNERVDRIVRETMDDRAIIVQEEVSHFDLKNFVKTSSEFVGNQMENMKDQTERNQGLYHKRDNIR